MRKVKYIGEIEVKPLAVFRGLTIDGENFEGCDLRGATFIDCTLRNCDFSDALLSDLDCFEEPWTEFERRKFDEDHASALRHFFSIASPSPWRESGAGINWDARTIGDEHGDDVWAESDEDGDADEFEEAPAEAYDVLKLRQEFDIDTTSCSLVNDDGSWYVNTIIFRSKIEGCTFGKISVGNLTFQETSLTRTSFSGVNDWCGELIDATCNDVDISSSNLQYLAIHQSRLTSANFSGSDLTNASFYDSVFESCNFVGSKLSKTHLEDLELHNCDFASSLLRYATGEKLAFFGTTNLRMSGRGRGVVVA